MNINGIGTLVNPTSLTLYYGKNKMIFVMEKDPAYYLIDYLIFIVFTVVI